MGESMGPFVEGSAVLTASIDGVGIVEDETFVRANEELAATFGYDDPADLVGLSWYEPYPPAERDRIEGTALPRVRAEGHWRGNVECRRTDGTAIPTVLSVSEDDAGRLVWVVRAESERQNHGRHDQASGQSKPGRRSRDADSEKPQRTDRSANGGSARRTADRGGSPDANGAGRRFFDAVAPAERGGHEDELRRLVETAPVPIVVFTRERGIVYCNRAAVAFFGATDREALVGRSPESFVHPDDCDGIQRHVRQVIDDRESAEPREFRLIGLDDAERIAEVAVAPGSYEGERAGHLVVTDVTEREERERELRRQRTLIQGILNTIPDVVFAFDERGEPIVEEAMLDEFAGYTADELAELGPMAAIPQAEQATALERIRRVLVDGETVSYRSEIQTKDGDRIPHEFRAAPLELDGELLGVVGSARDVTERIEHERALERQRDELATLDRINELLLETTRELIQTSSRDAVERTVCEQLTSSDLYRFAWVGEREFDGNRVGVRTSAGEDGGYLDEVTITTDHSDVGLGPVGRAMRTGEVQVANVSDEVFEPWREPAVECGFGSVAAVPLHHADAVYGVLAVYATREDAFSAREQAGFDVLGRTVGFVIHAARSHDQLFADAVVELEFDVDDDSVLVETAADFDCRLSLDGYVAAGEGWLLYLTVDDAPVGAVVEALADDADVERARIVGEADDGGRIELNASSSTLLATATAAGGSVRSAEIDADGSRITVEVPAATDVRGVVEHVVEEYPGSELLAQRECDRQVTTVGRPGGPLDSLTDRQQEVLEAAYRAGYYAWPRESTAEEVAEAVDIASPTLHGHLRKAEVAILSALFEQRDS